MRKNIRSRLLPICAALLLAVGFGTTSCSEGEYYCTHGFSSKDKLLRVQTISLINCDNDTAVVEAQGLSKSMPHKSISIKGNFKKGIGSSWYLESISQF